MPFDPVKYWTEYRQANPEKYAIKRTGLVRKPVKIKKVSKKREKELREYEKVKAEFLSKLDHCQYPGCFETELDLHHAAGRCGKLLIDVDTFRGLCRYHHSICELRPIEAKALGLSLNRL